MNKIRLVIADVDGTLVTPDEELTPRARRAVLALRVAGVAFAITSGRPPRGMSMLVAPLGVTTPIAAFNGGMLVLPDLSPIEEKSMPTSTVGHVLKTVARHKLDAWVYRGDDWFIRRITGPHVAREQQRVHFAPTVVSSFDAMQETIVKIVGISDDLKAVADCETELRGRFGDRVSAARSGPYHLDITHPDANKGAVVKQISDLLNVPTGLVATMGAMPSNMPMFALSGLSIAMGNASPEVQRAAHRITGSNIEDGFAKAVETYILADGQPPGKSPGPRLRQGNH